MDRLLARRLERDPEYRGKLVKLAKDYLRLGRDALAYWSGDFDVAYDLLSCYAPLNKQDLERLERGHPKRFVLPMTATQISTMATYVAQVLFGQATPHRVEGRGPEDEVPAEFVNQLLRWNAELQPMYLLGYLWAQDAIAVNRGVFYNSWAPIFKPEMVTEDVPDPEDVDPETGAPRVFKRTRRGNKVVGGYCKMELVSPYDFVCDAALPLWRLQDMRFCGHRTVIPVVELLRRSKLPPEHPAHVAPWAVKELKEKVRRGSVDDQVSVLPGVRPAGEAPLSRTAYERTRSASPTGNAAADSVDSGNVECWELWVRLVPADYEIHDGQEPVIFQFLLGAGDVLLSVSESTYAHGMFPYSVGEGRPGAHTQFSPGWVGVLKGLQDHVDWLKNRHQEALSRTIGNIFVIDPSAVDVTDFTNPDKEGLLITLKPEAYGKRLGDVFQQVPIKDLTERFHEEAMSFVRFAESVTAANSSMQGSLAEDAASATQYASTQQMAAGRMTSVARLLSSQALVPQTQQFVSNFQQFLTEPQVVRFSSDRVDLPPELQGARSLTLSRDVIQGQFDFIAHDGTLPGTDTRKVAAITRLLEASAAFPQLFTPGPGNLDPRELVLAAAKASGLNVERFFYKDVPAGPVPAGPVPAGPVPAGPVPAGPVPAGPVPAGPVPAGPVPAGPVLAPGPAPEVPALPDLSGLALPGLGGLQPRPANS